MLAVVVLNGILAGFVLVLAWGLWRWRCGLVQLNANLAVLARSPNSVRNATMQRRLQLAEARLAVTRWQLRSQQAKQLVNLVNLLRRLLFYSAMQRRGTRKRSGKKGS